MLLLETSNGRQFSEGSRERCLELMELFRLNPTWQGSWWVVGAAVYDEQDQRVDGFAPEPEVHGGHLFEPVYPVHLWKECGECGRPMCPGQFESRAGWCTACVYASDPTERPMKYGERPYEPPPPKKRTTSGRTMS